MRCLFAVPALLVLAACQTSTVSLEPVGDACGSLKYLSMVGTKWDAVPAGTFPSGARVIHPDTAVTRDFRPDRLNVHVNNRGRIERVDCG
jgi:hypothetical protein